MSNWDFTYVNKTPANALAPTTDAGVSDPDGVTLANAGIGAFDTTDKYLLGAGSTTNLLLFAVAGSPVLQVYVYSFGLKAWVVLADNVVPTPLVPARIKIPPYSRLYVRVQTVGTTTAVYAGYDLG